MKKRDKWILGTVLFIVLIAGAAILYNSLIKGYNPENLMQNTAQENQESSKAPDFTVFDEYGNAVKLSDMAGKPVVVNFWASWCPPCKAEMPDFEKMYKELKNDIIFMMVNMTDGERETIDSAAAHIRENDFTFPVYFDTEQSAAYTYQAYSLPATYFFDKEGRLVTYANGMIDYETLKKGIEMILR